MKTKSSSKEKAPPPACIKNMVEKYKPLLKPLVEKHPHFSMSLYDTNLAANVGNLLEEVGFAVYTEPKHDSIVLINNLSRWLAENHLVLLHYHPKPKDANLLALLKAVKKNVPEDAFKNLIPLFMISHTSQKQNIFKVLGTYGIRFVSFQDPKASVASKRERFFKELTQFAGLAISLDFPKPEAAQVSDENSIETIKKYQALLSQGEDLMQKGSYEEAIQFFTKAISLKPDFQALIERGDAYYKIQEYISALYDYREAFKLKQAAPSPHGKISACSFALVQQSARKGDIDKAKKWFALGMKHLKDTQRLIEKMISEQNNTPEMIPKMPYTPLVSALVEADLRGLRLEKEEEEISVISSAVLEKTITHDFLDPHLDVDARIDQAILLARHKQYEKAEKIFREIIKEDASNVSPAFNNFAVELRKNGEFHRAFEIYQELLENEIPDREIVVENLKNAGLAYAASLRENFRQLEAIAVCKVIIKNDPRGKEWVLCELAMAYLEMQNQAQASYRLMEAIYINPKLMSTSKFKKYQDLANLKSEMMKKLTECTS